MFPGSQLNWRSSLTITLQTGAFPAGNDSLFPEPSEPDCEFWGKVNNAINESLPSSLRPDMLSISEMGHFLNRTLWHDQVALTSSLRPWL